MIKINDKEEDTDDMSCGVGLADMIHSEKQTCRRKWIL
jgi:hypothetical protein